MYAFNAQKSRQTGVTLVELMISLVIGTFVALAALSSVQFFTAMQRQTAGINGSIANVNIAFGALKYETAQAGLGFFNKGKFACSTFNVSRGTAAQVSAAPLLPAQITTMGNVPTLSLFYATALESAASSQLVDATTNAADATAKISTFLPVGVGQEVLVVPSAPNTPCSLRTVTGVTASTGSGQTLTFGATGARNQHGFAAVNYAVDDSVLLMGTLQGVSFTLNNGQLVMTRIFDGTSAVLAKNVVAMVMQYGVAASGSSSIVGWRYPKNYSELETPEDWSAINAAVLADRVKAVRVSLLVRSSQKDKPDAEGNCQTTEAMPALQGLVLGAPAGQGMAETDTVTTALTGDWKCYRYAETSVVVPLRNLIVGKNT